MITQELDEKHFSSWTDKEIIAIRNEDPAGIADIITNKLLAAGFAPSEVHCNIHDADIKEVWDEALQQYVIENKIRHFHCVVHFYKDDTGFLWSGTIDQIASAIGIGPNQIDKPERGKFAYDNMLAYLIHIKYVDKAQYDPHKVYSTGICKDGVPLFKPYMEYYKERKKAWEEGRAKITAKQAQIDIDNLEAMILLGQVTKNQVLLTDRFFEIYARFKKRCDDAFDTFAQRKIARTVQAMEAGEFKVSVFFITGKAHAGKSMFTDCLVRQIQKDAKEQYGEDWTACSVAASNPFDEYMGEEILVMDDLRGMALTASDWLKLLDPDRVSIGSARYRNKKMACRCIIINSEKDVVEFFYFLKGAGGDRSEALDQFFRRIMARVVVYRVPDDFDRRRISVGEMQETDDYKVYKPDVDQNREYMTPHPKLTLHHNFEKNVQDMDYEEAQNYLSAMVMRNNGLISA